MTPRALIAAFAVLTLGGCMVGPDYVRPPTMVPAKYPDEIVPGPTAAPAAPEAIRADWWTLYNDGTLEGLVATALSDNLDIAFAVARIEEADANLREANAALFPEIDLGAVGARSQSSGAVTTPVPIRLNTDFAWRFRRPSRSTSGDGCGAWSRVCARKRWRRTTPRMW